MKKIDLSQLDDWASQEFDLIVHSHVLEHVPCPLAYVFFHLHRMLRPNGKHVCILPFMSGVFEECYDDSGREEPTRRFGQFDHVRRIGRHGIGQHIGKFVRMPKSFDATERFDPEVLAKFNIPEVDWRGFQSSTVLIFEKDDYLLQ